MEGMAVSAQKGGLLPISQQATLIMLSLSYHDYEGLALNPDEKPRLQADLRRHAAPDPAQPRPAHRRPHDPGRFLSMFTLQRACEIQVLAQGNGAELIPIPQTVLDTVPEFSRHGDARRRQRRWSGPPCCAGWIASTVGFRE